jgi:hypothetical protein
MTEGRLDVASRLLPIVAPPRGAWPRSAATIPPSLVPLPGEWVQFLMSPGTGARRTHCAWREHGSAPTHLANGRARWSDRLTRIEPPMVRADTASRRHADCRARPRGHQHGRTACARSAPSTRRTSLVSPHASAADRDKMTAGRRTSTLRPASAAVIRSDQLRRPLAGGGAHALSHDAHHAPEQIVAPAIGLCSATAKCSEGGLRLMRQNGA